ncbi:hypothetical protein TUSST3_22080 [Streptomyces sp. TUS-ST3]|nr:hypothetical protein TUSST3_22080 [Streptomyces sp. TUS-ST3]
MSRPSEWWAAVRSSVQGAEENGSATEGPVTREVAARAAMVVNTAAVLRSRGRGKLRGNGRGNGTSGSGSRDTAPSLCEFAVIRPVYLHRTSDLA